MKLEKETALIEAILFLESDPIDDKSLCRVTGLPREAVQQALTEIRDRCAGEDRGFELVEIGGGFMFAPKKFLWDFLRDRYGKKAENRLSRAALETLSIIAYSQPITRTEIENIRGVSADAMIKLLLTRNLVKEVGKKDAPGKPVQYGTTKDFLKFFRLNSIADLPKLDEQDKEKFELNG
jgi:segregation and condensation protein B